MFVCTKCDAQYPKWQGRCSECGAWATVEESVKQIAEPGKSTQPQSAAQITTLKDVSNISAQRMSTGIAEYDMVLGGGLVTGSLVLLGGEPGVGKSTLLLQVARELLKTNQHVMYVCGEESPEQIKLRTTRLGFSLEQLQCITATHIEQVIATIVATKPELVIVDSIQTVWTDAAEGVAGGIAQIRACTARLLATAKEHGITIIVVGHVTKEGVVAGPRTLEHAVDVVVYVEGDRHEQMRIIRAYKNRFGPVGDIAVMELTGKGFKPVPDPGVLFLSHKRDIPGTATGAVHEGSRVFFVDVQALVEKSTAHYPKRTVTGYDSNRLQVLLAVLHKHARINLSQHDVFVQLPGGLKTTDPNLDLAVCLALASAYTDISISPSYVAVAEIGLNGYVRPAKHQQVIAREAVQQGFSRIFFGAHAQTTSSIPEIYPITHIQELTTELFGKKR